MLPRTIDCPTLPIPNAKSVADFTDLYKRLFDVQLTEEQAKDTSRRFLQLYWILSEAGSEARQAAERTQRQRARLKRRIKRDAMRRHALPLVPHEVTAPAAAPV